MSEEKRNEPCTWHSMTIQEVVEKLESDAQNGLSDDEVNRRKEKYGQNVLKEQAGRSILKILWDQINSIVIYLLFAAACLAFFTERYAEGFAVLAVLIVNIGIGFTSEWRAHRSMQALRKLTEHKVRVVRDGENREVDAADLVPGDVVLIEKETLAAADMRLLETANTKVIEATLTGESVPVHKSTGKIASDADLADRKNMIYKGTSIADGSGRAMVVATGEQTELGHIARIAEEAESEGPPLQKRLNQLGARLAVLALGCAATIAIFGVLFRRQDMAALMETALALGIAAIPEGLPVVATIALARGMYIMAQRNALVNRLTAVETLGATTVIFSDKTGTLTENKMILEAVETEEGRKDVRTEKDTKKEELEPLSKRVLEIATFCNGASLAGDDQKESGDPTEVAILKAAQAYGLERQQLLKNAQEVDRKEFDPDVKMMATVHQKNSQFLIAVKGAPEAVLDISNSILKERGDKGEAQFDSDAKEAWRDKASSLAAEGLRVLAVAEKTVDSKEEEPYADLCFIGLLGLLDPPRSEVKGSIDTCQAAGIAVKMVTGDIAETARAIAEKVGIIGGKGDPELGIYPGKKLEKNEKRSKEELGKIHQANVFYRVSPQQKLNLISIYQNDLKEIVAMTGDGVNDAPALKKADIGIAMGRRGTDAAKQVSDMVLRDDAFESIVEAVNQGRVIFKNMRRSIMFMLCTNVAEVLAVTVAAVSNWTIPLMPMQILYLNVLTDVFPALALGVGPGSGKEMQDSPRDPNEAILTSWHWYQIGAWGIVIATTVLASLGLAEVVLGLTQKQAVTISFLTLAFSKLWFTFNLRDAALGIFKNEITSNIWVWLSILVCMALLVPTVYVPILSDVLKTAAIGHREWGLILGMSLIPFLLGQIWLKIQNSKSK